MEIVTGIPFRMADQNNSPPNKRAFPKFYEKAIPIALGFLLFFIVVVLLYALAVAAGVF